MDQAPQPPPDVTPLPTHDAAPAPIPNPVLLPRKPVPRKKLVPRPRPYVLQPGFGNYALAAFGSVLVGVTLPSLLTALRLCLLDKYADNRLGSFTILQILALIGAGPGAVVLSLVLMSFLVLKTQAWSMKKAITTGAFSGIGIAFLNLPGYFAFIFLWEEAEPVQSFLRVMLLFVVAGVTCGMWIGWQAWKGFRPKEGFLPRFTMKTMMMMVLLWGSVLVAFQPDRKDEMARWEKAKQDAMSGPSTAPATAIDNQ